MQWSATSTNLTHFASSQVEDLVWVAERTQLEVAAETLDASASELNCQWPFCLRGLPGLMRIIAKVII